MAFCEKCGTKLDEGAKFCLQCGTPVAGTQTVPPIPQEAPVQQAEYQQPAPQTPPPYQGAQYQGQPVYAPQIAPQPIAKGWYYFLGVFKKYAVFTGRASLEEFLAAMFIYSLLLGILGAIDNLLIAEGLVLYADENRVYGILKTLYGLALALPMLALTIRRMHDIGKSGWHCLIPVYGQLVLPLCEGIKGPNQYGPDPKVEA